MERVEKKAAGMSSPVQMARVMGNQAVVQRMLGGRNLRGHSAEQIALLQQQAMESEEAKDAPAYSEKKPQYLNSGKLRTALGGSGVGGEAHHIIPSCVVENRFKAQHPSKLDFNSAWNGIMLPGTIKDSTELNPLKTSHNLPYHRTAGQHDHPRYTAKVEAALNSEGDSEKLAANLKGKIIVMGAGKYIDDLT